MRIALAFTACVFIWGTTWYAIEWQLGYVGKEWSLVYRYGIAAVLIVGWCRLKGYGMRFKARDHLYMFALGLFLFSGNYVLVYYGTEYLTSGLVAVTFSLLTFLNILNARLFLGNPIQTQTVLAALLGVFGLALIFKPEIQAFNLQDQTAVGLLICLVSTLIASWGNTVAGAKQARALPILPFNAWGMIYGTLCNLVFALIAGEAPSLDPRPEYYVALLYLSVLGTVVAFSLFLWLLAQIGVARAGYMAVMTPLVALIISTLFEGYQWSIYAVAGVACVLVGNVLMIINKASEKSEKPAAPNKTASQVPSQP